MRLGKHLVQWAFCPQGHTQAYTSKIGSRNGFVRFGKFCIVRSLSPYGVLNSGHKLTVTYYGEITIEPILNPEFDLDHDFEVKNGSFQSLFPRFRVISDTSTRSASHSAELIAELVVCCCRAITHLVFVVSVAETPSGRPAT